MEPKLESTGTNRGTNALIVLAEREFVLISLQNANFNRVDRSDAETPQKKSIDAVTYTAR